MTGGWQTYDQSLAKERMAKGLCPECGNPADAHGGWGGPGCGLTDMGVAGRIYQFEVDRDKEGVARIERLLDQLAPREPQ